MSIMESNSMKLSPSESGRFTAHLADTIVPGDNKLAIMEGGAFH